MGIVDKAKGALGHSHDKQDEAFKDFEPFTDDELRLAVQTGELEVSDNSDIKKPEEYEGWDEQARGSKTAEEAQAEIDEGAEWV